MPHLCYGALRCLLLLAIAVVFAPVVVAQAQPGIQMPELRQELLDRRERDQAVRNTAIKTGAENPESKIRDEMRTIDRENTERMKEIVRAHGWPGPELVGRDGTEAAWLLVQHSTPDFQKEMLPLVEKAFREKKLSGSSYALLLDRVRVHEGKPQVYGSQGRMENGVLGLQPIEDEANVDQRRAEVGLGPLADYLAGMRSRYQSKAPAGPAASAGRGARAMPPNADFARLVELEKRRGEAVATLEAATDDKEKATRRSEVSLVTQQLAWARSVAGDYAGAIEAVRRPVAPSGSRDTTAGNDAERAHELVSGFQAREAIAGIVETARDRQIVILNEAHHLARHRAFALLLARELRAAGFEYLACETFNPNLDTAAMQKRGYPTKKDGSYIREPLCGDFVRQSLALGFIPVAYEHLGGGSAGRSPADSINERETGQANNLVTRILKDNPRARVLVYVGFSHLMKNPQNRPAEPARTVQWMAGRLKAMTGIDPLTIDQVAMTDPEPTSLHGVLLQQLFEKPGAINALILRHDSEAKHLVLGTYAGDAEIQIFHRPTAYIDGRPDWMAMNGYRKAHAIPQDLMPASGRRLIQAFVANETGDAIAVDQVIVDASADKPPVFMLPPGKFRFAFEE